MADIRAFIAIAVDPSILTRMAAVQQQLRQVDADVSWTRPEGMHLTLKFLGNIPEMHVAPLGEMLAHLAQQQSPFTITVAGTGVFPTPQRPRVIWAGVTAGAAELAALAQAVDTGTAAFGYPREDRPFRAHLTLGRVKSPRGAARIVQMLDHFHLEDFGEMRATSVALMRSELHPQGARYTPLRQVTFGG